MSEDLSQKEILLSLMRETREQSISLATLIQEMKTISSTISTHERRLDEHGNTLTKLTTYATLGATGLSLIITKYFNL